MDNHSVNQASDQDTGALLDLEGSCIPVELAVALLGWPSADDPGTQHDSWSFPENSDSADVINDLRCDPGASDSIQAAPFEDASFGHAAVDECDTTTEDSARVQDLSGHLTGSCTSGADFRVARPATPAVWAKHFDSTLKRLETGRNKVWADFDAFKERIAAIAPGTRPFLSTGRAIDESRWLRETQSVRSILVEIHGVAETLMHTRLKLPQIALMNTERDKTNYALWLYEAYEQGERYVEEMKAEVLTYFDLRSTMKARNLIRGECDDAK